MELMLNLLERDGQLELLELLLEGLKSGLGSVVVITGAAGSGKTALMTTAMDMAGREGISANVTSFSRFEKHFAVEQIAPGEQAALGGLMAPVGQIDRVRHDRRAECRVGQPRLLCFDDLHYADESAVREIATLALELRDTPVLLILTLRPTAQHSFWEWRSELQDRVYCHWISLDPMSVRGVSALAATRFGLSLSDTMAAKALELANGNLTLLSAIFADYRHHEEKYGQPECLTQVLGPGYQRAVLDHYYYGFEACVRETAQAVAMLGEYASPRTVAEVVDAADDEVGGAMVELTAAGLIKDGGFRQPVMEDVILAELSPQQTSVFNRRVASVLRGLGAPAVRVARHLIDADYVDGTWTGFLLGEALAQATALGDRQTAIEARRLALRGTQTDAERARVLIDLALVHAGTDPELCCQYLHEAGGLVHPDDLWRRHPSVLGDQFTRRGRGREAVVKLSEVGTPEAEASRLLVLTEVPELMAAHDAPPHRVPEDPRHAAAHSLLRTLAVRLPDPQAVQAAKDVLFSSALTENTASQYLVALTTLVYSGEIDLAKSLTDRAVLNACLRDMPVWCARLLAVRAEASVRSGDYVACAAEATEALRLMPVHAWGVRVGAPLACLLLSLAAGAAGAAGTERTGLSPLAPPAGTFETRYGLHYLYARGQHNLANGRAHAALADFASCGRLMTGWHIDREHIVPWRLAAAGAMLRLGDQQGAIDLIDDRFEQVGTTEVRGRHSAMEEVFNRLDNAVRAHRLVEEVRLISADSDARAAELTARYKIEDRYSSYLNKLSLAEQEVALRAAQGESNRFIARALSVSVSTVEQHLTKVYRKLGISGRPDLRARLG
jgi:DNA-binding CsgD family transcriptional regulator